jgi:hypothetical protein
MKKRLILSTLVGVLLTVTACGGSSSAHDSGSIAMVNFVDAKAGIRGVQPLKGWTDQGELVVGSVPGPMDEAIALVLTQVALDALPTPRGAYRGAALTWTLYTFETQLVNAGAYTFRIDLALAKGESASYYVALAMLPDAYDDNPALYETVFVHAAYALAPIE